MAKNRIVAVIASFNPDESVIRNIELISQQVEQVIVVDDGSNDTKYIDKVADLDQKICLIKNNENRGIAFVLNQGVTKALAEECTHIITFDQDTTIEINYVNKLLEGEQEAKKLNIDIGALAPHTIGQEINGRNFVALSSTLSLASFPVQSGLMIPKEIFSTVGFFDEDLVIDWVEFDFQYRLAEKGYKNVIVLGLHLPHKVGENLNVNTKKGNVTISSHSPLRYYYIARNSLIVKGKYEKDKKAFLSGLSYGFGHMINDAKHSPDGRKKIKYFLQGKLDGIRGKKGKTSLD